MNGVDASSAAPLSQDAVGCDGGSEPAAELAGAAVRLGATTVWSDVDLRVAAGSFTAVLGPNGAGKTTLLRVLLGLVPLSAGRVGVLGGPARRGNHAVGYVPQRRSLDPDLPVRGRDLVSLGLDGFRWGFRLPDRRGTRRGAVERVLAAVAAQAYADRPIGRLSGGEQQRLLLAQALIGDPRLLLLDEPLASLDVRNQATVARLVADITRERGLAAVMVTHDVNPVLGLVDAVAFVARGRVVSGTPDQVIRGDVLSEVYDAPVEVLRDSRGRVFVVGLEEEVAHPHGH